MSSKARSKCNRIDHLLINERAAHPMMSTRTEVRTILPPTPGNGRFIESKIGSDKRCVGNVPSPVDIAAESNAQTGTTKSSRLTGFEQNFRSDAEGGIRPESGLIPLVLSASVYKRTKGPHTKMARVQEESSTARPDSRGSGSRSPRFHEHIGEQSGRQAQSCSQRGASTVDSPTLGRQQEYKSMGHEIMRNQHLRKTAKYSATPSPKSSSPVRPEMHVDSDGYKWREL